MCNTYLHVCTVIVSFLVLAEMEKRGRSLLVCISSHIQLLAHTKKKREWLEMSGSNVTTVNSNFNDTEESLHGMLVIKIAILCDLIGLVFVLFLLNFTFHCIVFLTVKYFPFQLCLCWILRFHSWVISLSLLFSQGTQTSQRVWWCFSLDPNDTF